MYDKYQVLVLILFSKAGRTHLPGLAEEAAWCFSAAPSPPGRSDKFTIKGTV
jgi:hypothetical protein